MLLPSWCQRDAKPMPNRCQLMLKRCQMDDESMFPSTWHQVDITFWAIWHQMLFRFVRAISLPSHHPGIFRIIKYWLKFLSNLLWRVSVWHGFNLWHCSYVTDGKTSFPRILQRLSASLLLASPGRGFDCWSDDAEPTLPKEKVRRNPSFIDCQLEPCALSGLHLRP